MNRGAARQVVFHDDEERLEFGRRLVWIHRELGVDVIAYCLMDNHFHLVLRAPPDTLSLAMKHLSQVFTQRSNTSRDRDGSVFRGRFRSKAVENDGYLVTLVRYVHLNPLDIAGVEHPLDYRWSSYPSYVGVRPVPVFLDVETMVAYYGGDVAALTSHTEGTTAPRAERRPFRRRFAVDDVLQVIDGARAIEELTYPDRRLGARMARTIMLLVADRCGDADLRGALLLDLAPSSPQALRRSLSDARDRLASDPAIARILGWVEDAMAA